MLVCIKRAPWRYDSWTMWRTEVSSTEPLTQSPLWWTEASMDIYSYLILYMKKSLVLWFWLSLSIAISSKDYTFLLDQNSVDKTISPELCTAREHLLHIRILYSLFIISLRRCLRKTARKGKKKKHHPLYCHKLCKTFLQGWWI